MKTLADAWLAGNIRMPINMGFATTVLGWFCDPGFGLRFATPAVNRQPTRMTGV